MIPNFEVFDEEDIRIRLIINLYEKRPRKSMEPSPYALFFLDKGKDIVNKYVGKTMIKPQYDEIFYRINDEWKNVSKYEKTIYMRASHMLGYKPRVPEGKSVVNKFKSNRQLNQYREFLKLFSIYN